MIHRLLCLIGLHDYSLPMRMGYDKPFDRAVCRCCGRVKLKLK